MGRCKYCGLSAGLFSSSHAECKDKYIMGLNLLDSSFYAYMRDENDATGLQKNIQDVKRQNFIQDSDIAVSAAKILDRYTEELKLPYKSTILPKVQELICQTGLSYQQINLTYSLDKLSQKLIKGFLAEYFMGKKTLQRVLQISQQIRSTLPISDDKLQDVYYKILEQASHNFMKDRMITAHEQQLLDDFTQTLGIDLNNLPAKYQSDDLDQIEQNKILRDLQQGRLPQRYIQAPILLGKNEVVLWCYPQVTMYQEKVRREYVGRTSGWSFRVVKGVTYRTGGFKGHPMEHGYMNKEGEGNLYVTNKHIIFQSPTRSLKVAYNKLIGITPYSDGMELQRDGANAKRVALQGFDCSFILNILSLINI